MLWGQFEKDEMKRGVFLYDSGKMYDGQFADGAFNGQGIMVDERGIGKSATWKDGDMTSDCFYQMSFNESLPDGLEVKKFKFDA